MAAIKQRQVEKQGVAQLGSKVSFGEVEYHAFSAKTDRSIRLKRLFGFFFPLFTLQRRVSGIQDQEVTGISLLGSSWPLTNYLIKQLSNTFHGSALLLGVKRTEWTQNPYSDRDELQLPLVAAWWVGRVGRGRGINPL